jgi:hypothetical protein
MSEGNLTPSQNRGSKRSVSFVEEPEIFPLEGYEDFRNFEAVAHQSSPLKEIGFMKSEKKFEKMAEKIRMQAKRIMELERKLEGKGEFEMEKNIREKNFEEELENLRMMLTEKDDHIQKLNVELEGMNRILQELGKDNADLRKKLDYEIQEKHKAKSEPKNENSKLLKKIGELKEINHQLVQIKYKCDEKEVKLYQKEITYDKKVNIELTCIDPSPSSPNQQPQNGPNRNNPGI